MTKRTHRFVSDEIDDGASTSQGVLITLEGGDGAGKSTHGRILVLALQKAGYDAMYVREPGGNPLSEQLRALVLDTRNAVAVQTELFIYEAARAQLMNEVIVPALMRGMVVVCDRFTDSTMAYQGAGRGLDMDFIARANDFACLGVSPDRTLVLQAASDSQKAASEGLHRVADHGELDRLEAAGADFHSRVAAYFASLPSKDPYRYREITTEGSKEATALSIARCLADLFPRLTPGLVKEAVAEVKSNG